MNKSRHRPTHIRHVGLKSWLDYTSDHYSQQYHGYSLVVCFSFPSQDADEEDERVTEMNGVISPPKVRNNEKSVNECMRERME
jgi:hypothetical protein